MWNVVSMARSLYLTQLIVPKRLIFQYDQIEYRHFDHTGSLDM